MRIKRVITHGKGSPADKLEVQALDDELFGAEYGTAYLDDASWWLAKDGERVVGYAGIRKGPPGDYAFLCRAGVHPDYRGQGIHSRLIRARVRFARDMGWPGIISYTGRHNLASANNLIKNGFLLYDPHVWWGVQGALYFQRKL